jgi:hypothetical protein
VGHAFQIPPFHSWLKFKTWTDELGPIVGFRIFGRENIVISSEKIANNLLRERGTIYSSREHLTMAADYLSGNLRPLLLDYNGLSVPAPRRRKVDILTYYHLYHRPVASWSETHASSHNGKRSYFLPTHAVIRVNANVIRPASRP